MDLYIRSGKGWPNKVTPAGHPVSMHLCPKMEYAFIEKDASCAELKDPDPGIQKKEGFKDRSQ